MTEQTIPGAKTYMQAVRSLLDWITSTQAGAIEQAALSPRPYKVEALSPVWHRPPHMLAEEGHYVGGLATSPGPGQQYYDPRKA
jgi:hypothetical protein